MKLSERMIKKREMKVKSVRFSDIPEEEKKKLLFEIFDLILSQKKNLNFKENENGKFSNKRI